MSAAVLRIKDDDDDDDDNKVKRRCFAPPSTNLGLDQILANIMTILIYHRTRM